MAIFHVGERGERSKNIPAIFFGAEIGFHAPQGEQDPAFHPILLLNCVEGLGPFARLELRVCNAAI